MIMAKPRSTEAKLATLRSLEMEPLLPSVLRDLRTALADSSNLVVAEATTNAGKGRFTDLAPDLVAAFDRFLVEPVKHDNLCRAKIAIADALNQMEHSEEDLFWQGARHVQAEPV
jgi:hypothetical protein